MRAFARDKVRPHAQQIDRDGAYPQHMFDALRELGLFALPFPESYGGTHSMLSACVAVEELGRICYNTAYLLVVQWVPFGAILAGSNEFCENLFHQRRMFGGGLPSASLTAALALEGSKSFQNDFNDAMNKGIELLTRLNDNPEVQWELHENLSNIFPVILSKRIDVMCLSDALNKRGIFIDNQVDDMNRIYITVNVTLLRKPVEDILRGFTEALKESEVTT